MRAAHAIGQGVPPRVDLHRGPRGRVRLSALLRAGTLDRELAAGVPSWRSPEHAARAVWLTHPRRRRGLARALEILVERGEQPAKRGRSAAVEPCREQVRDALAKIMAVTSRLRSSEPIDARGVALLRALVTDGGSPCYARHHPAALTKALQEIERWLVAVD